MLKKTAHKSMDKGFTLVELLVVIAIIIILATVVILILNPIELTRRGHDANRLTDLASLESAVGNAISDATDSEATILCAGQTPPCSGNSNSSDQNVRKNDGTGWVKINLTSKSLSLPTLPIDPINNNQYHYSYATNDAGDAWEIDAVLESDQQRGRMLTDGGNNDAAFEVGSDLTILP